MTERVKEGISVVRWFNRLFEMEEINGHGACPTYLYRWTLGRVGPFAVYLHHFVGDDWSREFHDHPKRFWSIGLKGSYREHTPGLVQDFRAPWFRSFPAEHQHRLTVPRLSGGRLGDCWTLVIVGRKVREWGFWHHGYFVPWREYVDDGRIITEVRSCP